MTMTRSHRLWLSSWELLVLLLGGLTTLISSIHGDPISLVSNGDFEEILYISFNVWPQFDVIHDGDMNLIIDWQCVHGGVQMLDATEYVPDPAYGGAILIHMNYRFGPGVIISSPLVTPRKGATYNLTFSFADNPDGGPMFKALRVRILVNSEIAEPIIGDFNISSPESQRDTIQWVHTGAIFVGSGESTTVQFESLTEGSFGPLIDNVQVTLMNVVGNPSFEITNTFLVIDDNTTWFDAINASTSETITSWTVASGVIKYAGSRWQGSTDASVHALDLNADDLAGRIVSNPFPTVPGYQYVCLYDAAASPEAAIPVYGGILASVKVSMDGEILNSQLIIVNADGFSINSLGWETYTLTFKAPGTSAVVEFTSKIAGSDGPLLDNVNVYQVVPTAKYKSVPLTYNTAATRPRPSMWITVLAGVCSSWTLNWISLN